ncbi:hypothetical protein ACNQ2T_01000 [Mycoplasma sp. Z407A]|uniref:hypothetical protein n=1 Tax=Mycoplasma sp. Z407A TaxID=3401678 RepID=UPI003AAB2F20
MKLKTTEIINLASTLSSNIMPNPTPTTPAIVNIEVDKINKAKPYELAKSQNEELINYFKNYSITEDEKYFLKEKIEQVSKLINISEIDFQKLGITSEDFIARTALEAMRIEENQYNPETINTHISNLTSKINDQELINKLNEVNSNNEIYNNFKKMNELYTVDQNNFKTRKAIPFNPDEIYFNFHRGEVLANGKIDNRMSITEAEAKEQLKDDTYNNLTIEQKKDAIKKAEFKLGDDWYYCKEIEKFNDSVQFSWEVLNWYSSALYRTNVIASGLAAAEFALAISLTVASFFTGGSLALQAATAYLQSGVMASINVLSWMSYFKLKDTIKLYDDYIKSDEYVILSKITKAVSVAPTKEEIERVKDILCWIFETKESDSMMKTIVSDAYNIGIFTLGTGMSLLIDSDAIQYSLKALGGTLKNAATNLAKKFTKNVQSSFNLTKNSISSISEKIAAKEMTLKITSIANPISSFISTFDLINSVVGLGESILFGHIMNKNDSNLQGLIDNVKSKIQG